MHDGSEEIFDQKIEEEITLSQRTDADTYKNAADEHAHEIGMHKGNWITVLLQKSQLLPKQMAEGDYCMATDHGITRDETFFNCIGKRNILPFNYTLTWADLAQPGW